MLILSDNSRSFLFDARRLFRRRRRTPCWLAALLNRRPHSSSLYSNEEEEAAVEVMADATRRRVDTMDFMVL